MARWSSAEEREDEAEERKTGEEHPYDFRVCGPRNLSSPTWKDIFSSSWYLSLSLSLSLEIVDLG